MDANDLRLVEQLAHKLYNPSTPQEQQEAEKLLSVFSTSPVYLQQCRFILDNSQSISALMFAAFSLQRNVTKHFAIFDISEKIDLRNYLMQHLVSQNKFDGYVPLTLAQLICRITKMGWFDSEDLRSTMDLTVKLMQTSHEYCGLGLLILSQLVQEMNQPTSQRSLARHRKIAAIFREGHLLQIFQIALTILRQLLSQTFPVQHQTQLTRLQEQSIALLKSCLTFDFIGSSTEDTADDTGTVHIPSNWRALFEEPSTMQLFFDSYAAFENPNMSSQAMECLVQMASVRRSLFQTDADRNKYLNMLMRGIHSVLATGKGLQHVPNYHELCRLLARLKATYQMGELVTIDIYPDWIDSVANLTIRSFRSWQWAPNSLQYLLSFWSKMITSSTYMVKSAAKPHRLETYLPQILRAYIVSRIESVEHVVFGRAEEDGLEDEESVLIELELVSNIARWQYTDSAAFLVSTFDPIALQYQELIQSGQTMTSDANKQKFTILEGQLTWLVYIMSKIIGNRTQLQALDEQDALDGELACKIIQLISVHDNWMAQMSNQKMNERMDASFLLFFQQFRKAYIGEQAQKTSKVYHRLSERLGLNDQDMLLNFIMRKLATNLRIWSNHDGIIQKTLDEFQVLTAGYSSLRLFAKIETVHYIIRNYNSEHFPFLDNPRNFKYRTLFSGCLAKLLFTEEPDKVDERFGEFIKPLSARLDQLSTISSHTDFRNQTVQLSLIGVFRDLRGITSACDKKNFSLVFDWFYPRYSSVVIRALEALYDVASVTTPILKFFAEFVQNRNSRMQFDVSSPNGILLFRETSSILSTYGERIIPLTVAPQDRYDKKLKGISICFTILRHAISGAYVNFGVFKLYGDPALDKAIDIFARMLLTVQLSEMMSLTKLCRSYFNLLESFVQDHLFSSMILPREFFVYLMASFVEGLKSVEITLCQQSCAILDHLCGQVYKQVQSASKVAVAAGSTSAISAVTPLHPFTRYITENPEILRYILTLLFQIVLFEDSQIQFSISRPLLVLILMNEEFFADYTTQLVQCQPVERREWLKQNITTLMSDVDRNLSTKNRELFTQKITFFRRDLNGQSIQALPPLPSPFENIKL